MNDIINTCITPHQINLRYDLVPQKYIDKFHSRVDINFKSGCWLWQGGHKQSKNKKNYGAMGTFKLLNGKNIGGSAQVLSHRLSWVIHYGEIPIEMDVCHKCDNPNCCNPEHLFLGTHQENMQDMVRKGRHIGPRGTKTSHSRLSEDKISKIRILLKSGISKQKIADIFKVNYTTIYKINRGETWRWFDGK